jgi:hypothetical protein
MFEVYYRYTPINLKSTKTAIISELRALNQLEKGTIAQLKGNV